MTDDEYHTLLLPKYLQLSDVQPGEPPFMRLRSFQHVIRMHKFHKTKEYHEYIYSELLQYCPFQSEAELYRNDEVKCVQLYNDKLDGKELIKIVDTERHLDGILGECR